MVALQGDGADGRDGGGGTDGGLGGEACGFQRKALTCDQIGGVDDRAGFLVEGRRAWNAVQCGKAVCAAVARGALSASRGSWTDTVHPVVMSCR